MMTGVQYGHEVRSFDDDIVIFFKYLIAYTYYLFD